MPDQVTVTGKVGPNLTVTTLVITNVSDFRVDTVQNMLYVSGQIGGQIPKIHEFDVNAATVMTVTKSGNNWTVAIS